MEQLTPLIKRSARLIFENVAFFCSNQSMPSKSGKITQGVSFSDRELLSAGKDRAEKLGLTFSSYVNQLIRRDVLRGGNRGISEATLKSIAELVRKEAAIAAKHKEWSTQPNKSRIKSILRSYRIGLKGLKNLMPKRLSAACDHNQFFRAHDPVSNR